MRSQCLDTAAAIRAVMDPRFVSSNGWVTVRFSSVIASRASIVLEAVVGPAHGLGVDPVYS